MKCPQKKGCSREVNVVERWLLNGGSTLIPEMENGMYYFSSIILLLLQVFYKNCNSPFRWVYGLADPKKDAERSRGIISEWIPWCANTVHHVIISQSKGIAKTKHFSPGSEQ